jgi:hypothetical protein
MRMLFWTIITLSIAVMPASAQVDTLQLVEIGSIEAPGEIVELYVEDLDGDSLKEIILTTGTNVHIYNGITYEEIWAGPELDHPRDLLFADINLDGFIDFSVKDTTNIHLFDPHNNATIWTSPEIDSTYSCYTIGDRNDDDWTDVAIVSKEIFTRVGNMNNMDTVWIELYNGPSFQDNEVFNLLVNYWARYEPGWYWVYYQNPTAVSISELSGDDGQHCRIMIFTKKIEAGSAPGGVVWEYILGNLWVINSIDFAYRVISDVGFTTHIEFISSPGAIYLHSLVSKYEYFRIYGGPYEENDTRIVNSCSADTLYDSNIIWESNELDSDWKGVVIDDVNYDSEDLELCFSSDDSVSLCEFPSTDHLWTAHQIVDLDSVLFRFRAASFYENPQVICQIGVPLIEYQFYDGSDGSLTAILPEFGNPMSDAGDLDSDGNDEILSISDDMLYIYGLQPTDINDDNPITPDHPYLLSNYPNPFNSSTTIECGLPEAGPVTIEIYDLLGRRVEIMVDDEKEAGHHRVVWDAGDRSSGIYFYKITSGEFSDTRRMVLLK